MKIKNRNMEFMEFVEFMRDYVLDNCEEIGLTSRPVIKDQFTLVCSFPFEFSSGESIDNTKPIEHRTVTSVAFSYNLDFEKWSCVGPINNSFLDKFSFIAYIASLFDKWWKYINLVGTVIDCPHCLCQDHHSEVMNEIIDNDLLLLQSNDIKEMLIKIRNVELKGPSIDTFDPLATFVAMVTQLCTEVVMDFNPRGKGCLICLLSQGNSDVMSSVITSRVREIKTLTEETFDIKLNSEVVH